LAGRFHDPLVGRDLLAGAAVGTCLRVLECVTVLVVERVGAPERFSDNVGLITLQGGRYLLGCFLGTQHLSVLWAMGLPLFLVLLSYLFHNKWLGGAFFVLFWSTTIGLLTGSYVLALLASLNTAAAIIVLIRYGLLASVATMFCLFWLRFAPLTSDISSWYFGSSFFSLAGVAAIGLYGFHASVGLPTWSNRSSS
jgi:hypothetical protein